MTGDAHQTLYTLLLLLPLLLLLACAAPCHALQNGDDSDTAALFVVPCAATLTATAPGATTRVVYDGLFLAAHTADAARAETRVLYRPDLRASFRTTAAASGASTRCWGAEPGFTGLAHYNALVRDLRALARCPLAPPPETVVAPADAAERGMRVHRVVGCAAAGQFAGATVRVAVDAPRPYLRAVTLEGGGSGSSSSGMRLGDAQYTQLVFVPGHAPRTAYTVARDECADVAAYAPARVPPARREFDPRCRVRTVSPLLRTAAVLAVPGAGALVAIIVLTMRERKRAADLKKIV